MHGGRGRASASAHDRDGLPSPRLGRRPTWRPPDAPPATAPGRRTPLSVIAPGLGATVVTPTPLRPLAGPRVTTVAPTPLRPLAGPRVTTGVVAPVGPRVVAPVGRAAVVTPTPGRPLAGPRVTTVGPMGGVSSSVTRVRAPTRASRGSYTAECDGWGAVGGARPMGRTAG
jgi:hypothetical protein